MRKIIACMAALSLLVATACEELTLGQVVETATALAFTLTPTATLAPLPTVTPGGPTVTPTLSPLPPTRTPVPSAPIAMYPGYTPIGYSRSVDVPCQTWVYGSKAERADNGQILDLLLQTLPPDGWLIIADGSRPGLPFEAVKDDLKVNQSITRSASGAITSSGVGGYTTVYHVRACK